MAATISVSRFQNLYIFISRQQASNFKWTFVPVGFQSQEN